MDAFLGPSGGTIKNMFRVLGAVSTSPEENLTEADIRAMRRLVPLQNIFYLSAIFRALEPAIGDALGAKKR